MDQSSAPIQLRGVRVHNLRAIDLDLPLGQLIVITGVSGAGKSSLAFDTLFAEGQRRYIESFPNAWRQRFEQPEPPVADSIGRIPPAIAVRQEFARISRRATVGSTTEVTDHLRLLLARLGEIVCPWCEQRVEPHSPDSVARFLTALPPGTRMQIGFPLFADAGERAALSAETAARRLAQLARDGFHRVVTSDGTRPVQALAVDPLSEFTEAIVVVDRLQSPISSSQRLHDTLETAFREGAGTVVVLDESAGNAPRITRFCERPVCGRCGREFPAAEPALLNFNSPLGACPRCRGLGALDSTRSSPASAKTPSGTDRPRPARDRPVCPECSGTRLQPAALALRLAGLPLPAILAFTAVDALRFLESQEAQVSTSSAPAAALLLPALLNRLQLLDSVGLGYLTLDRPLETLSRGEISRVRLAGACGSNLVNLLYVLDEPMAGLHPSDRDRLLEVLFRLRDAGNTIVAVEHDRAAILSADLVVDLGPQAGPSGGRIVYQGPPPGLRDCGASITGAYLTCRTTELSVGAESPVGAAPRRVPTGWLTLDRVFHHNLNGLQASIPLGVLCVVTGVSGSGKSSLIEALLSLADLERAGGALEHATDVAGNKADGPGVAENGGLAGLSRWNSRVPVRDLAEGSINGLEQIDDLLFLGSTPAGRSAWSQVAGTLGIFDEIRRLFAATGEAQVKNLTSLHFSFSARGGGGCETCAGRGQIAVDLQFLPDVIVTCPDCHGTRYRREILEVKYRGLSIAEVLALAASEAFAFFRGRTRIQRRLKHLKDTGLDYLSLGRSTGTLSGGESQRLKLAAFLAQRKRARTLILLEEPTVGLHPRDVERVIECWNLLLAAGHSVLVVEHNLAVVAAADFVIDLGPGAGPAGGTIVSTGAPEELARNRSSITGRFLAESDPRFAPSRDLNN